MSTLIFDIETVGEDFDMLDETSQEVLAKWIKKESEEGNADYKASLEEVKQSMGLSPLTGHIVAVGIYDGERSKGAVYYDSSSQGNEAIFEEGEYKFEKMTEKAMLERFWDVAKKYDTFVTFNGRQFDVPYLMVRSAVHSLRPSKNLLTNRYVNYQPDTVKHIDLFDQLTFYGALRRKGGLHLWCRAFGIESPKLQGVRGEDMKELFERGKNIEIARYNARDVRATYELYKKYQQFLQF